MKKNNTFPPIKSQTQVDGEASSGRIRDAIKSIITGVIISGMFIAAIHAPLWLPQLSAWLEIIWLAGLL